MRNLGTTLTNHTYTACIGRYSQAGNHTHIAIMFNVMDENGNLLTDHVWIKGCNFILDGTPLKKGETVSFRAEPYRYIKGVHRNKAVKALESDIGLRNVLFLARQCQKN